MQPTFPYGPMSEYVLHIKCLSLRTCTQTHCCEVYVHKLSGVFVFSCLCSVCGQVLVRPCIDARVCAPEALHPSALLLVLDALLRLSLRQAMSKIQLVLFVVAAIGGSVLARVHTHTHTHNTHTQSPCTEAPSALAVLMQRVTCYASGGHRKPLLSFMVRLTQCAAKNKALQ